MTTPLLTFHSLPAGDAGTYATLQRMQDLVDQALTDPWAVSHAKRILSPASRDAEDIVAAIEDVLTARIRYQDDPIFVEFLQSPEQLLDQMMARGSARGDCDDVALFAAFLGAVYGLRYRLRAVGFGDHEPYAHVYTLLYGDGQWFTLDVTRNPVQATAPPVRALDLES